MMRTATAFQESVNPFTWFRAIVMDLGFAGLIEEIEKRFGKFVTTLVLATLLLAIFLWGLQMVGLALTEAERLLATGSALNLVQALAIRIGILLLVAGAIFGFMKIRLDAAGRRILKRASEINDQILKNRAELERLAEDRTQEYRERWAEVEAAEERTKALIAEANRKIQALSELEGRGKDQS